VAVIVSDCSVVVVAPVTVNVPEVLPAGIVMLDADTVATDVLALLSVIVAPPVGAAANKVTVPVAVPALCRLYGLTSTLSSSGSS
jgi:hypothetical protein